MLRFVIPILLLTVLLGCQKSAQPTASATPQPIATPKLLFLNFNIKADSAKHVVTLLSTKTVDGTKKKSSQHSGANHIIVQLLNRKALIIQSDTAEHPLIRNMEYANDDKEFARKIVTLKEADFSVRMNFPADAESVHVTEVINKQNVGSTQFRLK